MSKKIDETTDIFAYTNRLLEFKEDLDVELFFVSKNFVPYALRLSNEVMAQLSYTFLDPFMEAIFEGAEKGMVVRDIDYTNYTKSDQVLLRTDVANISTAQGIIDWLEGGNDIEFFSDDTTIFKNMKGLVARFTHKSEKIKFYIAKSLGQGVGGTGRTWQLDGETLNPLRADAAFRVPDDNQTVIVGNDAYIFNLTKFESLFKYSYARLCQADVKAKEFEKLFRINVPTGLVGIQNILRVSPALLNKFLKADITLMSQDQVMDVADNMGLDLMQDDTGAIIIMDSGDLSKMLDVISDNYYKSQATGQHYVASSKKAIEVE